MSILYVCIAYGTKILSEFSIDQNKNFSKATSTILSKIPSKDSKLTYAAETYLFHYDKKDGIVFMCMAEESLGRKIPFTFLAELQRKFTNTFTLSEIKSASPYGLTRFNECLSNLTQTYNQTDPNEFNNPSSNQEEVNNDQIHIARNELANVKEIMIKNVGEILSRGERIELLLDKTDNLSSQSNAFRKRTQQLRRKMWWKNTKMIALSGLVGVLIFYILMAQACGATLTHCTS
ncbi:synaptobrevin-domain-containing protein [Melampsora americana]|nr:synaptobrevin-domain-containing protein [Melampsora americana]